MTYAAYLVKKRALEKAYAKKAMTKEEFWRDLKKLKSEITRPSRIEIWNKLVGENRPQLVDAQYVVRKVTFTGYDNFTEQEITDVNIGLEKFQNLYLSKIENSKLDIVDIENHNVVEFWKDGICIVVFAF